MKKFSILIATLALAGGSAVAQAESVTMSFLNDDGSVGKSAGTITLEQTKQGLKFTPKLMGLPPGEHGFHVHEKGSCASTTVDGKVVPGGAAGGHLDPHNTKAHKGPLAHRWPPGRPALHHGGG